MFKAPYVSPLTSEIPTELPLLVEIDNTPLESTETFDDWDGFFKRIKLSLKAIGDKTQKQNA